MTPRSMKCEPANHHYKFLDSAPRNSSALLHPFYGYGYGYPGYPYLAPALKAEETEAKAAEPAVLPPFVAPYYAPYVPAAPVVPAIKPLVAAPFPAPYYAAGYGYPASSQFHAQDEFGNLNFGYSNINSAKAEAGNTYGGVSGGYQYVDANGILQTISYVADGLGFRTVDSRLPVTPEVPEAEPLVQAPAPVFEGEQIPDTPEVAEAKAEFQKAYDAAKTAAEEAE
ncbi:Putative cuticle protein [Caligus rogercresseyi]|uniref:Cuticle protein n=1 Tax=Caligus rogercresseyi TaxID=217165 RepID=A0A7T8HIF4_CALRO|nr:Putative cuticle protein [Caligus rogercresseyi]